METYRILVVDDTKNIHDDFRRILSPATVDSKVDSLAAALFDEVPVASERFAVDKTFDISFALQGRDALDLVETSLREGRPYAMAFVDMRMPPGWDGLETISAIWAIEKELHVVICTAYSDHSWSDIVHQLGQNDRLLVIKKPFEAVEVIQCAHALCEKWRLQRVDRRRLEDLELRIEERTCHLQQAKERLEDEMVERRRVEIQLRHAQKLESVGQLAAGIAHEINTPIQFVGNSVEFLREGFGSLCEMMVYYRSLLQGWEAGQDYAVIAADLRQREEAADLDYIIERSPAAFERSHDGVARVTKIVRAMKEFAYPSTNEQQPADINHSIEMTLEVARSEYKLVADVETDYGSIPEVTCSIGDLNQVMLNLIVNAAHAIADAIQHQGNKKGKISISTRSVDDQVFIVVRDTGAGIPESIIHKVFDPFFTTKPVGKGTGQGLAIAHTVIVEKHEGTITVDSQLTVGTTIVISLPVAGVQNRKPEQLAQPGVRSA